MLIEVLLLHRQLPADAVVAGMATVLKVGSVSTDLVAIETRKAVEMREAEDVGDEPDGDGGHDEQAGEAAYDDKADGAKVISLHARLPPDVRTALPDISKYDRPLKPATTQAPRKGTSS